MSNHLTWAQIDLNAIRQNFRALQRLAQNTSTPGVEAGSGRGKILTVIKADAYGHGMLEVAKVLAKEKVDFMGLSNVNEGISLRKAGIKTPVLLFETTLPEQAKDIIDYRLTPTVCTDELAAALNRYAQKIKRIVDIHVEVDTGMGRLGIWHQGALEFFKKLKGLKNLRVQGIYTHFACADTDHAFTREQIRHFLALTRELKVSGWRIPLIHAANSMGLIGYGTHFFNLARPGLMLYGLYPRRKLKEKIVLTPAMSVHSRIIFLKKIVKGRSISYGRTFTAATPMTVATLPVGYSDGYLRDFSGRAWVIIAGQRCPVLGRVTMDQIVVDVSKVKNPKLGMPVVIMGRQGQLEISADELAQTAGTISYEIVCSLGSRLPKVYQ